MDTKITINYETGRMVISVKAALHQLNGQWSWGCLKWLSEPLKEGMDFLSKQKQPRSQEKVNNTLSISF